ncbi:MAG: hypothetical protein FJ278_19640, partial [Planctomycetes bacterium]|nr:hypothetical protein [Planctomycetota bacterium]
MSDSRRAVVWVSCAMVLLHVVCVAALGCLSPESSGRVPFRIVQVATGLGLLFFVPGMLFCLGVLRRPQLPLFDLLCFSFAANSVLYITVTTG